MRNSNVLKNGDLTMAVLNNDVLAVVRNSTEETVALLMNFSSNKSVTVNLTGILPYANAAVSLSNVGSNIHTK